DLACKLDAALAAPRPDLRERNVHAQLPAAALDQGELRLRVRREAVDGHDAGQAVDLLYVLHVPQEVRQAALKRREVFLSQLALRRAAVVLEGAHRRHDDDGRGPQTGHAALDVEKL